MTNELVFGLVKLALSVAESNASGTAQRDAAMADNLLQLVQKGAQAYAQHTGEPLDPNLIKPEQPV